MVHGAMLVVGLIMGMPVSGQVAGGPQQALDRAVKFREELRRFADEGVAAAQYMLGICYAVGWNVAQDYAEAAKWYRKAAEQKHADARLALGMAYASGRGVAQDYTEAAKWVREAARQGHAQAQLALGVAYLIGGDAQLPSSALGTSEEREESVRKVRDELARQAASGRNVGALELAIEIDSRLAAFPGLDLPHDPTEAAKWIGKAAHAGRVDAQFFLGLLYFQGQGLPKDFAAAAKWLRKPAEGGNLRAEHLLGLMHYRGWGVPQDYTEAARWLRKPAEEGNAEAQLIVGVMYATGRGVPQDLTQSYMWFHLGAAGGESAHARESAKNRDLVGARMTPAQTAEAKQLAEQRTRKPPSASGIPIIMQVLAVQYLRERAEKGEPEAQYRLGIMLSEGKEVPRNLVQAYAWLDVAATTSAKPEIAGRAAQDREGVAARMTPMQIVEARELAKQWKERITGKASP